MTTPAQVHEAPDDPIAAIEYCYEQGWTDGLPVVPPIPQLVEAMMSFEGRPPETVLAVHPATGLELTVQAAAVNAVMAGCRPEYFPVLVAAFEAMNEEPFNFHGSTASTGGPASRACCNASASCDVKKTASSIDNTPPLVTRSRMLIPSMYSKTM